MYRFKPVKQSDVTFSETLVHKSVSLNSGSKNLLDVQFRSGSPGTSSVKLSGSYYETLRINFYLSSSYGYDKKFQGPSVTYGYFDSDNPQFRHKFHKSGSLLSIPQEYYGEYIKKGSFKLVNNGNLFALGATITQSNTSISSSANYIGNIFYEYGIITITETGSFTSGVSYTDVLTGNYLVDFSASNTIYTTKISVNQEPGEFNITNNPTARRLTRDNTSLSSVSWSSSPYLKDELTSSNWRPYMTTIGLYDDETDLYPVMVARYPQPIKMRNNIGVTFKIKFDE